MAVSNKDRIGKALDEVRDALLPYISKELEANEGIDWKNSLPLESNNLQDISVLLRLFMKNWKFIFKKLHSDSDRAYVSELLDARNKWAHSAPMSSDDVERYLDTAIRLCKNIKSKAQAESINRIREEIRQQRFTDRERYRSKINLNISNDYQTGLKPWREVITPHQDVVNGTFQQAQFAADLDQVFQGKASDEYGDPIEFFKRTFITEGLKDLLSNALKRFNNLGGDPVIELQTNFGGGKTHSMLALFHLCSGVSLDKLPGLEELCNEIDISSIPRASRAVFVGTAFEPATVDIKPDGTKINTIWGELAWQLGGKEGFSKIAESDLQKTPPGNRALADLLNSYGPCLVLIDEWVAYGRKIINKSNLPAGTLDAQLSFAHELTEAAKQAPNSLVLISVPESIEEFGSTDGEAVCNRLKQVISRIAREWRPASGPESFKIVRRRLFEPIQNKDDGTSRDAVIRAYCDMYNSNKADFPEETFESNYKDLMKSAYPIHPDLFRRLYEEWSTLERFQKTRGVLRLLALTIESLWRSNSKDLLIMPSSIPLHSNDVKNEFLRFLDNKWEPIISLDVDGEESIPTKVDKENPNLGRYSACKRVSRTLYIGTAPGAERQQKGINDLRVKVGCVMPGERIAIFGDALRKFSDKGRYIQQEGDRYWIDTSPNLNRTAEDYKNSYLRERENLLFELNLLIQKEGKKRGKFSGLHAGQINNNDIPDTSNIRLVILATEYQHKKGETNSKAMEWIKNCLKNKGNAPREYLNTLIFLAPDESGLNNLLISYAEKKAWQYIKDEKLQFNLTANQEVQTDKKIEQSNNTLKLRIPETWSHLLVPSQEKPGIDEFYIEEKQINSGSGSLSEKAFEKSREEQYLYEELGVIILLDKLNNFLWKDKNHIIVKDLVDWCQKYLYLPRISSSDVIINALQNNKAALSGETTFYLAEKFDENSKRYSGLRHQSKSTYAPVLNSLIVKNEIAEAQKEETPDTTKSPENNNGEGTSGIIDPPVKDPEMPPIDKPLIPKNFRGTLKLDPTNASLKTSQFMSEVMSHLQALPGSEIDITLDINVKNENGIDKETARIILENSITLKLDNPEIF